MKKLISCLLLVCMTVIGLSTVAFAESPDLTPREIETLLADVTAVEVEPGVYVKDDGTHVMYEVDMSYFDVPEDDNYAESRATTWDLSTPYVANFSAHTRVDTQVQFKGYKTLYVGIRLNSSIFPDSWTCGLTVKKNATYFESIAQYTQSATIKFTNVSTTTAFYAFFAKGNANKTVSGTITVSK